MNEKALCILLLLASALAPGNGICAPPEAVYPCTCEGNYLQCGNLNEDQLLLVFNAQKRHSSIGGVQLSDYRKSYIPSGLLLGLDVQFLHVKTSSLLSFRDPNSNQSVLTDAETTLKHLIFEYNDRPIRNFDWNSLPPLPNMERLFIYGAFSAIETPLPSFPKVNSLIIQNTQLDFIVENAFAGLKGLAHMLLDGNPFLTVINRNSFPNPAEKLSKIYFVGSAIKLLPEDLFEGMPVLTLASLSPPVHNIPPLESTVPTVLSVGNGLTCDCRLKWLLPMIAEGKVIIDSAYCRRPLQLRWRSVKTLTENEIC